MIGKPFLIVFNQFPINDNPFTPIRSLCSMIGEPFSVIRKPFSVIRQLFQ